MKPNQLRLLPGSRPLSERFGDPFFRAIPQVPGVYRMYDRDHGLLYVGQSGNLRDRLGSYRHVDRDHCSSRLVRLVHAVEAIDWEICSCAAAARVREAELLRTLRPRFNRQGLYAGACWYLGLRRAGDRIEMRRAQVPDVDGEWFGPFKGLAASAWGAWQRAAWFLNAKGLTAEAYPTGLLADRARRLFEMEWTLGDRSLALWEEGLRDYLHGQCMWLVDMVRVAMCEVLSANGVMAERFSTDLEVLRMFYRRGPERIAALRQERGMMLEEITPEALADLLAWAGPFPNETVRAVA